MEENFFSLIKGIHGKPTTNIILNGKDRMFTFKIKIEAGCPPFYLTLCCL
jgi:hypothetical protein